MILKCNKLHEIPQALLPSLLRRSKLFKIAEMSQSVIKYENLRNRKCNINFEC